MAVDTTPTLLEELAREVLALRAELANLRQQIATEVRTRRLLVEHESGFESIVAEVDSDLATVKVAAQTDPSTYASILANEQGAGVLAGIYLSGGGNGAGMFEVQQSGDDGAGDFPGNFDPNSITYSACLDLVEDRGRIRPNSDGVARPRRSASSPWLADASIPGAKPGRSLRSHRSAAGLRLLSRGRLRCLFQLSNALPAAPSSALRFAFLLRSMSQDWCAAAGR